MRGGAVPVLAVGGVEGPEVELLDRLDHKPGEVVFRQPVAQVRGQEQRLVSVSCEEVLWHARMVQNRPDSRGVCATASMGKERSSRVLRPELISVGRRTANGPPRLDPHPEGAVFGIGAPCAETRRQFGPSAWKTWL